MTDPLLLARPQAPAKWSEGFRFDRLSPLALMGILSKEVWAARGAHRALQQGPPAGWTI